jgi:heterodisulfide reductase subunit A-like polyferredoxin
MDNDNKIGSVLVIGGGIAGMQAALDCANAGFKVYLTEQQPSIGGNMARLDKTFPTNDCAMCMISPKLVECGRHLNIEIISNADVKKVAGSPGHFHVSVNKRARFVDEQKCNGCGDCERACPVLLKDTFNGELSERHAIYRLYPQAIPDVYTIDKAYAAPPCRGTCPAGVNAQGYIALIAKGKFLESLDTVRERMPFAGSCGRVCHHPCESNCNRAKIDAAVSVRNLKRFVADYEWDLVRRGESIERPPSEEVKPEKRDYTEPVAIVGGGPAGLTCANDLAKLGYRVTVFEAHQQLGGMMRLGIPAYRLPRDVLDHEIGLVVGQDVEVRTGLTLGKDFTLDQLKAQGYQATFVATGAQLPKRIPLEGGDAKGVLYGVPFLREVNTGGRPEVGKRIAVIGGGNVAMDVARCALRANPQSSVALYCLESRDEMPAYEWEILEAIEEGVEINPSWGPGRVIAENGAVKGLELIKCTSVFDEEKRFNPIFDTATKKTVEADTIILAVGQACDLSFTNGQLQTHRGVIEVDRLTLETTMKGVFAGGDNVLGPASLVQAVEQGHRAAESIHRYLRGLDLRADREPVARPQVFADVPSWADCACVPRTEMPHAAPSQRKNSFLEIDSGYSEEVAVAEAKRCLNCGVCSVCKECVRVCKAHAIDHNMTDVERELEVGAIVVTSGYDLFDPQIKAEYGFGRYRNVVTNMQFERILSASGPYEGHVQRPSDGKAPKKVAWIQCVGSRDAALDRMYCSSVCCMSATKEAIIAKEHERDLETTIFFIDMRAFGKGFEGFYNRAKENYGVRYVRSQVSSLKENPENQNVIVRYVQESNGQKRVIEEEFDLVVLSVGLVARGSTRGLGDIVGFTCNQFGFAQGAKALSLLSGKDGVYLCGAISGPKDIPETVMESSAAAALCGELLQSARGTRVRIKEYPPEKDVSEEPPRIGVFVCHCGTNIASVVDVAAVSDYVQSIPGVVYAEHTIYTCSQDTQERIKQIIKEKNLNRVIVASCSPRTHEPLFQETIREAGLNKYLFEMADIREQCAWVHQREGARATEKAKALVRGSVGKAKWLEPLQFKRVGITRSALIIGGGIAGMSAALSLSRQGFEAHVVEKSGQLGGQLRQIKHSLEGYDWQKHLKGLIAEIQADPTIHVHLNTEIDELTGFIGNFTTRLKGENRAEVKHGVVIVATGASEFQPEGFLFGKHERVITQRGLEKMLDNGFHGDAVVMIQCVGSRDKERPYCSRVCCGTAVKNALAIKEKNPNAKVYVLYRDIRTYQFKEEYYWKARDKGVMFIHFQDETYPEVVQDGKRLAVKVLDTVLDETLTLSADWVVLSAAIVPERENNARLAELAKVSLNEDGFFMEAHVKLRPVDFANEGIFVCGLAHSPKYTEENIVQALAAAGRAACILAKDSLEVGGVVSHVDPDKCATCLTCVRECVYNAPFLNTEGKAEIEEAKCQGCGNCAAACPAKAIQLRTFTDVQERALFRSLLAPEESSSDHMVLVEK